VVNKYVKLTFIRELVHSRFLALTDWLPSSCWPRGRMS